MTLEQTKINEKDTSEAKAVGQDRNAAAYEITAAIRITFKLEVQYCSFRSAIVLYGSVTIFLTLIYRRWGLERPHVFHFLLQVVLILKVKWPYSRSKNPPIKY